MKHTSLVRFDARHPRLSAAGTRFVWWFTLLLVCACSVVLIGCSEEAPHGASEPNLLQGHLLSHSRGVERPDPSVDGVLAPVGDFWNTPLTTILRTPDDELVFDLGSVMPIEAAMIQADNNDTYTLAGSVDGQTFTPFWKGESVTGLGMTERTGAHLHAQARYVRLTAAAGDGSYAIAEVQVYQRVPQIWPYAGQKPPVDGHALNSGLTWAWAAACVLFLLLGCAGSPVRALGLALPVLFTTVKLLAVALEDKSKFGAADLDLLRAVTAGIALLAVLRELIPLERTALVASRVTALLGLLAVISVGSFYNLGRPQFYDAKLNRPSYVHNFDMRVYFPVAKYFNELHYDGLYLASVASFIDNHPGTTLKSLGHVELRDLTNHEMRKVADVAPQIDAVRLRFTPERWSEFCRDMSYFQETMGRDFFGTMIDHGGNATPFWLTVANLLFRWTHASNAVLLASAALDPLLLALFAWAVARAFSLRMAFLCLVVFGANDYYMLGSNWGGSTLRHDWMVALGLAAVALKRQRFATGGALLAVAGLIRAFPALALAAALAPAFLRVLRERKRLSRWPTRAELLRDNVATLRVAGGALVTGVLGIAISAAFMSLPAWHWWLKKASVLAAGEHLNDMSLRTIVSLNFQTGEAVGHWNQDPTRVALLALGCVVFTLLVLRALKNRRLEVAALLGLLLVPIYFSAANYYFHVVFLFPLLAATTGKTRRDLLICSVMCLMCVADFATSFASTLARHFMGESFILLTTYALLLLIVAHVPTDEAELDEDRLVPVAAEELATP